MLSEKRRNCCDLPVRQKLDNPSSLKITYDGAIAVIAAESPVVNPDDAERIIRRSGFSSYCADQSVIANWDHQTFGERCRRSPSQSQPEMMYDSIKPSSSTTALRNDKLSKSFDENSTTAECHLTNEAPCRQAQLDFRAGTGQIGNYPNVTAMNTT
ncbi:hypothetical protein RvVAR0630_34130 [Agrobacterium vitis]|nr:hypothetical protein RvVAR0630_34130 [Agrobacterium vitis]